MLTLEAGVGEAEITPELGTQLDGNIGQCRPCKSVSDPLWLEVLVLRQGQTMCCLITMDLLAVTREWTDRIRAIAATKFGIPGDSVIVHVSQTHSAPSLGHIMLTERLPATKKWPWLRGSDAKYHEVVMAKVEQAMAQAVARLSPVSLRFGGALDGRMAFNRRYLVKGGRAEMAPRGQEIIAMEGPSDPDVGVIALVGGDGATAALLLHHTCHPVHAFTSAEELLRCSADWPGAWRREVSPTLCPRGVSMVVNGCCGNVMHTNLTDPTFSSTAEKMGRLLAESTHRAAEKLTPQEHPKLAWARTIVQLPYRPLTTADFDAARDYITQHPDPIWTNDTQMMTKNRDWCYAASLLDVEELFAKAPTFPYEIQAIRIGDVAILAVMGEPFVEGQIQIKAHSPAKRTIVAHMCNGYAGYIPTAAALSGGGYEAKPSMGSKYGAESLGLIVEASLKLLNGLWSV